MMSAFLLLSVATLSVLPAVQESEPDVAARDPWAIDITGMDSFDLGSIRRALLTNAELRESRRESVPESTFRQVLQDRLLAGLHLNGFLDASVAVTTQESGRILATVKEGPAYEWGDIRLVATPDADMASITAFLQQWKDPDVRAQYQDLKGWDPAGPVKVSDEKRDQLKSFLEDVAKLDLRRGFDCSVELEPQRETHTVIPVITVANPGYHSLISQVMIEGSDRTPDQEIRKLLDLPDQIRLTRDMHQAMLHKLGDSGRFLHSKIWADAAFDEHHAVPLHIQIRDNLSVPPLPEPMPEFDEAVCRMARWLSLWGEHSEDLQFVSTGTVTPLNDLAKSMVEGVAGSIGLPQPTDSAELTMIEDRDFFIDKALGLGAADSIQLRLTCSRDHGIAVGIVGTDSFTGQAHQLGALLTQDAFGFADTRDGRKWVRPWFNCTLTSGVELVGQPASDSGHVRLQFSYGFSSGPQIPLTTKLKVEPAALIHTVHELMGESVAVREGPYWRVTADHCTIVVHDDTGRPETIRWQDDRHHVECRSAAGLLNPELLNLNSPSLNNLHQNNRDISSLAEFLFFYVQRGFVNGNEQTMSLIERAIRKNSSLDRLARILSSSESRKFSIPSSRPEAGVAENSFARWSLRRILTSDAGAASDRLIALYDARSGDPELRREFIRDIEASEDLGPLSCLVLTMYFPAIRDDITAIAFRRMDVKRVFLDIEPWLDSEQGLGSALEETYSFVRSLSEDETELLAIAAESIATKTGREGPTGEILAVVPMCLACIRKDSADVRETTFNLLSTLWDPIISESLVKWFLGVRTIYTPPTPVRFAGETTVGRKSPQTPWEQTIAPRKKDPNDPATILDEFRPLDAPKSKR
jgi:hypothetical protein